MLTKSPSRPMRATVGLLLTVVLAGCTNPELTMGHANNLVFEPSTKPPSVNLVESDVRAKAPAVAEALDAVVAGARSHTISDPGQVQEGVDYLREASGGKYPPLVVSYRQKVTAIFTEA